MPSKIHGCTVQGNNLVVESTGDYAGGMIGQGDGVKITAVGDAAFTSGSAGGKVTGLKAVKANRYAGGIAGSVVTADAIGVLNQTLGVGQFIPFELSQVSVEGTNWTVTATEKYAAGACGLMLGGKANGVTINNIQNITAGNYTGGFAGKVDAGAAVASDGLNLLGGVLNLDISQLVNVLQVYIPIIQSAGVKSAEKGFTVEATDPDSYAGGYLGYGGGVQIKDSDVTSLKHTKVTPPGDSLESANGESYFSEASQYAVKGGKFAGGYAGCVDIDSAAAVGGGLKLLGNIQLTNLLEALNVVASTIKNSDVNGCVGGYSVLANGSDINNQNLGKAGGFIGEMSGTIIKNSDANLFAYIIGREAAGGYVGRMKAGVVTNAHAWDEKNGAKVISLYDENAVQLSEIEKNKELDAARQYNQELLGNLDLLDPFSPNKKEIDERYQSLLDTNGAGMMGYIRIPKIDVELPIYHGTEERVLQSGVGHFEGTSLPVGGESTHAVLTGHRGLPSKILFTDLDKLVEGDVFYIKILGETFAYQVDQILTVLPEDTKALSIEPGKDYLTLVTCTPYAVNTHRLLVRGVRIPYEEAVKQAADERITPKLPFQVKMLILAVVILILIFIIYLIWKKVRKRKTGDHENEENKR